MTLRPDKRAPTTAEIHFAHYRKTASYATEEAAARECRATEIRRGWPNGAMSAYLCAICDRWHTGRERWFVNFQRKDHRPRPDVNMVIELGERVASYAKLENSGPPRRRRAHFRKFGPTIERMKKRESA